MPTTVIHGARWAACPARSAADRIGAAPERGHRLVDHRDRRRVQAVAVAQRPAGEHRHAERLEVARAGDVGIDVERPASVAGTPSSTNGMPPGRMLDSGTELVIAAATTPGDARSFSRMPEWMRNVSCGGLCEVAEDRGGHHASGLVAQGTAEAGRSSAGAGPRRRAGRTTSRPARRRARRAAAAARRSRRPASRRRAWSAPGCAAPRAPAARRRRGR